MCFKYQTFYFASRAQGTSLAIYTDANSATSFSHQTKLSKAEVNPWHNLGPRAERNKENNAIPTKWTANKVALAY